MPSDSTPKRRARKAADRPKKPYPDFPLSPHPCGKWQKKIRGQIHYFGAWAKRVNGKLVRVEGDGWKQALEEYKAVADDLHAGRTPRVKGDELTVADLCNRFRTAKLRSLEAGEIGQRMYDEYKATTDRLVSTFGGTRLVDDLAADDFEGLRDDMAKLWGPVRLGNEIQKVRTVFKYGYDAGLIEKPLRYGPVFKKPAARVIRRHRAQNGERMLEAAEVRQLLDAADVQMRAMLLLGCNCAFGNHDIATLPMSALDLEGGWINFARPKTGIPRRCPLWPETVTALKAAMAARPAPRHVGAEGLVFLTVRGRPWLVRGIANPVSVAARNLMKTVGVHHGGVGFYTLRHVFRTIADAARDPVAIDLIMGHLDPTIAAHYRERIDDTRLLAVSERVRSWLFGEPPDAESGGPAAGVPTDRDGSAPEPGGDADRQDEAEPKAQAINGLPLTSHRPTLRLYVG
jgi:integrase